MHQLKDAIDKAVTDQYPPGKQPPAHLDYIRTQKKSERDRWMVHYSGQLNQAGYRILSPGSPIDMKARMDVHPEFKFHPVRLWRFDFALPAIKLAIEIDGGIWRHGGGAHSHPSNIMRDIEKSNHATLLGWHILRFTDREIKSGQSILMTNDFVLTRS